MHRFWVACLCSLAVVGLGSRTPPSSATYGREQLGATATITIAWMRVDTRHPRTLFIDGRRPCDAPSFGQPTCDFMLKSTDGGATWHDLGDALGYSRRVASSPPLVLRQANYDALVFTGTAAVPAAHGRGNRSACDARPPGRRRSQ